jgi:hypothetical protein
LGIQERINPRPTRGRGKVCSGDMVKGGGTRGSESAKMLEWKIKGLIK